MIAIAAQNLSGSGRNTVAVAAARSLNERRIEYARPAERLAGDKHLENTSNLAEYEIMCEREVKQWQEESAGNVLRSLRSRKKGWYLPVADGPTRPSMAKM